MRDPDLAIAGRDKALNQHDRAVRPHARAGAWLRLQGEDPLCCRTANARYRSVVVNVPRADALGDAGGASDLFDAHPLALQKPNVSDDGLGRDESQVRILSAMLLVRVVRFQARITAAPTEVIARMGAMGI